MVPGGVLGDARKTPRRTSHSGLELAPRHAPAASAAAATTRPRTINGRSPTDDAVDPYAPSASPASAASEIETASVCDYFDEPPTRSDDQSDSDDATPSAVPLCGTALCASHSPRPPTTPSNQRLRNRVQRRLSRDTTTFSSDSRPAIHTHGYAEPAPTTTRTVSSAAIELSTRNHETAAASERLTFTITEAARALGVSRTLAYELARTGQLRTVKLGRRLVVPRSAISELLAPTADH